MPNAVSITDVSDDIKWVNDYASGLGLDYTELMQAADDWAGSMEDEDSWGEYLNRGGLLEGYTTSPKFWECYERIRMVKLADTQKGNFFTCAC